mmetsp:Transcript_37474/g.67782  ORF Transcript_37474/g.67782 Transcript_37474/m.67782 type:complete len:209 (-) Transcript_37474:83-709(-)
MSDKKLSPLPPPVDITTVAVEDLQQSNATQLAGNSTSSSVKMGHTKTGLMRSAKSAVKYTNESYWQRQKQEKDRRANIRLNAKKSLEKLPAAPPLLLSGPLKIGTMPLDLYDPVMNTTNSRVDELNEQEELVTTMAKMEQMKRMLESSTSPSSDEGKAKAGGTAPPEVQDWISKTLAGAPRPPQTVYKGVGVSFNKEEVEIETFGEDD